MIATSMKDTNSDEESSEETDDPSLLVRNKQYLIILHYN